MAMMPWDIDAGRYRGTSSPAPTSTKTSSYSGPYATYRNSTDVARNRTFTKPAPTPAPAPTRRTSTSSGSSSGSSRSSSSGSGSSGGSSGSSSGGSSPSKRKVEPRKAGPLPLTAEETSAFANRRRAITKAAQLAGSEAARAKLAALESFKSGRFNLNSQAQMALRDIAGQAGGRGRGQARSSLQTYSPMSKINLQRQTGMGTLQSNLTTARADADASRKAAMIERDAALANLEQQMAMRQSMPRGFFTGMVG